MITSFLLLALVNGVLGNDCGFPTNAKLKSKFTVLHFFNFDQERMSYMHEDFSRIRDFYIRNDPDYLDVIHRFVLAAPIIALYKLIADSINSTLVSEDCADELSVNYKNIQLIHAYPKVALFRGSDYVLSTLLDDIKAEKEKDFSIVSLGSTNLNFAYCDVSKTSRITEPWRFFDVFSAVGTHVWLCILTCATLCSVALVLSSKNHKFNIGRVLDFLCSLLSILVAGDLGLAKRIKPQSFLLFLWTMMCLLLGNLYGAELTTGQTLPPSDKPFTEISELYQNNFTLVYTYRIQLRVLRATINHFTRGRNGGNDTSDMSILRKISKRGYKITYSTGAEFAKKLVTTRRIFVVNLWEHIMSILDFTNLFKDSKKYKKAWESVHCYIGKKLLPAGERYHLMFGSDAIEAKRKSDEILEAGLFSLWYKEWSEMRYANRVQDRKKVVSRTKVKYEFEDERTAIPLSLNDKILSMFCLLVVGLAVSTTCFIVEKVRNTK